MRPGSRVKLALRRVLPSAVVAWAISARDGRRLRALPSVAVEPGRLRYLTADNHASFLRDVRIDERWNEDSARISTVFEATDVGAAVNPGDRRALYHAVAATRPSRLLEIGTDIGGSTLALTQAAATHVGDDAMITTVDIVDVNDRTTVTSGGLASPRTPAENLTLLGLRSRVTFVTARSGDHLRATEQRFDFVLVDGDHSAPAVYQDIVSALGVLAPGGVIVLHDYFPDKSDICGDGAVIGGPFEAVARLVRENPDLSVLPLGSLPWPTKHGSHVTTLAVLTTR